MEESISFDEWFEQEGYDPEYEDGFRLVWNAAIDSASAYVESIEGTDFGVGRLKGE